MLASLGLEASVCMYVSVCLSVYLSTCESAGVTGAELAMADYSSTDGPIGAVNDLHKSTAKLSVPVVDLADLSHAKEALAAACTDWGFFQVGILSLNSTILTEVWVSFVGELPEMMGGFL